MVGFDQWPPENPSASTEIPQMAPPIAENGSTSSGGSRLLEHRPNLSVGRQLEKPNAKQELTVVLRPDDIERTKKLIGSEQLRGYRLTCPPCLDASLQPGTVAMGSDDISVEPSSAAMSDF